MAVTLASSRTFTLINAQANSTMYAVITGFGNINVNPETNSSYAQLGQFNLLNPAPGLTKYGPLVNNKTLTATRRNSFTLTVPGSAPTYVYVWINKGDPSVNVNAVSDVMTGFTREGPDLSSTSSAPTGSIIQYSGNNETYYMYMKRPMTINNNSSNQIKVRTEGISSQFINGSTTADICPSSIGFPSSTGSGSNNSSVQNVDPGGSVDLSSAFPNNPYTMLQIWRDDSGVSHNDPINYASVLQAVNMTFFDTCNTNPPALQVTRSGLTYNVSDPTGGTQIGLPCIISSDCTSNNCIRGICRNPRGSIANGGSCTDNSECTNGNCMNNVCQVPPTGGNVPNGGPCTDPTDCKSGICTNNFCLARPGTIMPGGSCTNNSECSDNGNCISGMCQVNGQIGSPCTMDNDCGSGNCDIKLGRCIPSDMGAGTGNTCKHSSDCSSRYCDPTDNVCKAVLGQSCSTPTDCSTGVCSNDICKLDTGATCIQPNECASGNCSGGKCQTASSGADNGQPCSGDTDCSSGNCGDDGKCAAKPDDSSKDKGILPWWGWLVIAIVVVIFIILIIVLATRASKKD